MIRSQTCPICRRELPAGAATELPTFPFCSARCRQIDFFRWYDGSYAIVEPLSPDALPPELLDELEADEG